MARSRLGRVSDACPFSLLNRPRFAFRAACILFYVGIEVAIGSMIVNYLARGSISGVSDRVAGGDGADVVLWGQSAMVRPT